MEARPDATVRTYIREYRLAQNRYLVEVAEAIGMSKDYVAYIEKMGGRARLDDLYFAAQFLHVNPYVLFDFPGVRNPVIRPDVRPEIPKTVHGRPRKQATWRNR